MLEILETVPNHEEIPLCTNCKSIYCKANDPKTCFNFFTPDDASDAYELIQMGNDINKVLRIFSLNKATFIQYMIRAGYLDIRDKIKPPPRAKVNGIDPDQAFRLYKEGNPFPKIAYALGYKEQSIRRALQKHEPYIRYRKKNKPSKKFNYKRAFKLYIELGSMRIVAEKMDCNTRMIWRRLNNYQPYLDWKESKKVGES